MTHDEKLNRLLERLKKQPLFDEHVEFGKLCMKHIESFTDEERRRYEELKVILKNQSSSPSH